MDVATRPQPLSAGLAAAGLVGVVATLAIAVGGSVDWGRPGSPAYATYELVNRLTGSALALLVAAPLALRSALTGRSEAQGVRRTLAITAAALILMVVGSVAEFWVFTAQPYRGPGSDGRNVAWLTYLLSGVALLLVSVVAGTELLRRRLVPAAFGLAVALAAPVGIAAAALGASLFVGVPLVGLAMCVATPTARQTGANR